MPGPRVVVRPSEPSVERAATGERDRFLPHVGFLGQDDRCHWL
jgi:hypothetical protein